MVGQEPPPKHADVVGEVRRRARKGLLRFLAHAGDRKRQRGIDYADIKRVLCTGQWEQDKDRYDPSYHCWHYSIKGKTVDGALLVVAVIIKEPDLLVVTVHTMEER